MLSPLQEITFRILLESDDADYVTQAIVLAEMHPEGW